MIGLIANKIIFKTKKFIKKNILRDRFLLTVDKWYKDNAEDTLRYDYPLNENSIVFDVGAYKGEFTEKIFNKYQSNIYAFEPVSSFYKIIQQKFLHNAKIKTYQFGLGDCETSLNIGVLKDASSTLKSGTQTESIKIKDIANFIEENNIQKIDLIKINIEGGEFPLLQRMIETDTLKLCKNIQVQFHNFYPNAVKKREEIRQHLSKTHNLTYDYYFVWENWELK